MTGRSSQLDAVGGDVGASSSWERRAGPTSSRGGSQKRVSLGLHPVSLRKSKEMGWNGQHGPQHTSQRNGAHVESPMTRPPCLARSRVRRFPGQKSPLPAAHSTPFLCSCAKKRGGAPKKRAYGCRHGSCSVPPASPTDSKPQHHSRLRQADFAWPIYPPCTNQLDSPICPVGAYAQMGEAGGPTKVMWRRQKRFSLAARHRFFGQAPKKWGRKAGKAIDHRPRKRRTRRKP